MLFQSFQNYFCLKACTEFSFCSSHFTSVKVINLAPCPKIGEYYIILFSISCNQIDNRTFNYTDNSEKSVDTNDDEASLLIGYYDIYKRKSSLLKYKLVNGILQSVDTLNTFSSDSVYYSKINRILKNRYIITGVGDIIDIETNSILKTENSTFSYSKGDSLIFYLDKPKEYGLYNLKNRTYKKVSDSFFSSNRKYFSSNNNYKLSVENHTNKKDFANVKETESTELNKTSFINQNNLFQKKIILENRNGRKEIVYFPKLGHVEYIKLAKYFS